MANFWGGTPDAFKQLATRNPQQMATQGQLGQAISPLLQNILGNRSDFGPIAAQARNQFQTQVVPGLAERLTAFGGQGGQRSSAYPAQLSSAGANLERGLAADQQQFNMQNRNMDQNLLSLLLGYQQAPSFENLFMPGRQGALHGLTSSFGQGLGAALPHALMAGLTGGTSLAGSGLSGLSSLFSSLFAPRENTQLSTQNNANQALMDMLQRRQSGQYQLGL